MTGRVPVPYAPNTIGLDGVPFRRDGQALVPDAARRTSTWSPAASAACATFPRSSTRPRGPCPRCVIALDVVHVVRCADAWNAAAPVRRTDMTLRAPDGPDPDLHGFPPPGPPTAPPAVLPSRNSKNEANDRIQSLPASPRRLAGRARWASTSFVDRSFSFSIRMRRPSSARCWSTAPIVPRKMLYTGTPSAAAHDSWCRRR